MKRQRENDAEGLLSREVPVRVLDVSASGSLIETTAPLEVGAPGRLHLTIDGAECVEEVRVVRRTVLASGVTFHVALEFVRSGLPGPRSLRAALARQGAARLAAGTSQEHCRGETADSPQPVKQARWQGKPCGRTGETV